MTPAALRHRIALARLRREAARVFASGESMDMVAALVRAWREMREEATE